MLEYTRFLKVYYLYIFKNIKKFYFFTGGGWDGGWDKRSIEETHNLAYQAQKQ